MADGNAARAHDRADQELDLLIQKRETYLENSAANEQAELWRSSKRRYLKSKQQPNREAWAEFHKRQAALFEELAAEHRDALGRLIDGGAGG